jgi:hypothetical protein
MHSHDRTLLARLGFADPDRKGPSHDWACQYLAQKDVAQRLLETMADVYGKKDIERNYKVEKTALEHHITKGEGKYQTTIGFADLVINFSREYHATLPEAFKLYRFGLPHGMSWHDDYCTAKPTWIIHDQDLLGEAKGRDIRMFVEDGELKFLNADAASSRLLGELKSLRNDLASAVGRIREKEKERTSVTLLSSLTSLEREVGVFRCASATIERTKWRPDGGYMILVEVKIAPVPIGDAIRQLKLYREHLGRNYYDHGRWRNYVLCTRYKIDDSDLKALNDCGFHHFYLGKGFAEYTAARQSKIDDGQAAESVEI